MAWLLVKKYYFPWFRYFRRGVGHKNWLRAQKCIFIWLSYPIFSVGFLEALFREFSWSICSPDPLEKTLGFGCCSEGSDQGGALAPSQQGDLFGMTSEMLDVAADPLQGRHDVPQSIVARRFGVHPLRQRVQWQESEHSTSEIVIIHERNWYYRVQRFFRLHQLSGRVSQFFGPFFDPLPTAFRQTWPYFLGPLPSLLRSYLK